MDAASFWMVWRENGDGPRFRHDSQESAEREAERLARQHPGAMFHVLRLTGSCVCSRIEWRRVPEEMPF